MGMLYENTDCKNEFYSNNDSEEFIKVKYLGYHREGYHLVRLKFYPESKDHDEELKLVHESLFKRNKNDKQSNNKNEF